MISDSDWPSGGPIEKIASNHCFIIKGSLIKNLTGSRGLGGFI